jgi:peptide/nickel transport system substrate-binding protein
MENRFGFKDFFLFVLLLVLIVSVWLAMKQYDRQWTDVRTLNTQVRQLTSEQAQTRNEVNALRRLVERGVRVTASSDSGHPEISNDPFVRMHEARQKPEFAEGDWLIDAFPANVAAITPHVYKDLYGRWVQGHVLEGLIGVDPETLEQEPHIAELWDMSEDGLTITFKLRRGVVFSDGHPLTSEDVVFSFELMNNPRLDNASERQFYSNIDSCTARGDYEVTFRMKEPHYMALGMAGGRAVLPKHFYSNYTIDEINRMPGLLMGSGPYRMPDPTSWTPGKLIELVRNERYWGPQPGLERIIFREVNNDIARLTMFRNGEIDRFLRAVPEQYVSLQSNPSIMERAQPLDYLEVPSGYNFIAWNQKRDGKPTVFADKRVRQAMTFLTPRQQICTEVYLGFATPVNGPFTPGSRQYNPTLETRPYDPDRGKALLKEAGLEDRNGDGVLEDAAGRPFRFKFMYPAGAVVYERGVLFLKDSYARAGIVLEPDPIEWSVFSTRLEQQEFDAVTMFWGGGAVEADVRQMFHSSQTIKGGDNFMNYFNPELDRIIDEARRTIDEDKRMTLWHEVHRILWEDQPYTFMLVRKTLDFIDRRVHNVQLLTTGVNERWEWFVPQGMQKWTK